MSKKQTEYEKMGVETRKESTKAAIDAAGLEKGVSSCP